MDGLKGRSFGINRCTLTLTTCNFIPKRELSDKNGTFMESGPKWTVQKGESGRSRTIVDGLLSQSGRSWVKADGHSTKNGQSLGINRSVKVDGPKVP